MRTENADSVSKALETHAAATGAAWGELLAPFLAEGEELPDMTLVQRLMARLLVAHGEELQEADAAWLEDRDDIIPPRLRRRSATARVLDQMQRLRLTCQGHFGRELASQIVVAPDGVSDRPRELLAQAEATLARLQDPAFAPPGEALAGCDFDPLRFAAALAPEVAELRAALEAVSSGSRKSESTLVAKQQAMARLDREYSGTVKMFQGLYTFLDQAGLAERLRPPRPRRSSHRDVPAEQVAEELAGAAREPAETAVLEGDFFTDEGPFPRLYVTPRPVERDLAEPAAVGSARISGDSLQTVRLTARRPPPQLSAPEAPSHAGESMSTGSFTATRPGSTVVPYTPRQP